ncbi:MAG: hypothetical protein DMF81_01930 [Acidobacteria bacterium]|nr:MAG: hypothetical protein DMF81_01930 [Acidobacteriota bacterium]
MKRSVLPVLAAVLGLATSLRAQGVTIDHKAVGCIVAEQYPKMSACFVPAPSLARSRVYFRAGGTPHWYFVDGKQEMPCHAFVLPKPKKTIKKIDYYVEGLDRSGGEGRTAEYNPDVVPSAAQCRKDVPVAPFLTRATVVVGATPGAPALIPGFSGFVGAAAGGLSSGAVLGIVAGGAAVAGAAVAISSNNNNETTSTTSAVTQPPVTTQAPATTTTTTTTTLPTQPFSASFGISPNPPNGKEPLAVTFDECASTGVDLKFIYDFAGDGNEVKAGCNETRVYRLSGVSSSVVTTLPPATRAFDAVVCVGQAARKECHNWHIVVSENTGASVGEVTPASRRVAWSSELDLEGGSGQVVVNGEAAAFASRGRSSGAVQGRRGLNRVEAQVVEAAGRPGTWRFELDTTASLQAGSVRVIAGEVALVTESAIVFRLKGKPGERVVFSFRTER